MERPEFTLAIEEEGIKEGRKQITVQYIAASADIENIK